MSAAANIAAALVALIPAQAGDRPFASSIADRITVAVAEVSAYEEGRLYPVRVRNFAPWSCVRGRGRTIACSVRKQGPVHLTVISYRASGGKSTTRVIVRRTVR